ncbi:MAG: IS1 family transposase [Planctomycetaceae bacterium]|nr:IS1 family transposase [Planctomycetaceae bacterium]
MLILTSYSALFIQTAIIVYKSIDSEKLVVCKKNTQKIERKYLSLRTWCSRLVRKGIRFSKTKQMHKIVVGVIINVWFFSCHWRMQSV